MARSTLAEQFLMPDMPIQWYGSEFRNIIEAHLANLRFAGATIQAIAASEGWHYRGDFYSLLIARSIPSKYHWIVLRVNKLNSPLAYDGSSFDLIIPNEDNVNSIWDLYRTTAEVD